MLALAIALALAASEPARGTQAPAHDHADRVILIVWDGMRADFVSEANTPTLWKLSQEGVTFRQHHSVYPSLTSVNATALATGVYPNRSGPIANYEYLPEIDPVKAVRMDAPATMRAGDKVTGGNYLAAPTVAELVSAHGGRTAIAGTKPAPMIFDRHPDTPGSVTLVAGETIPETARAEIEKLLGPFPNEDKVPCADEDRWTTRALTEAIWQDQVPTFSVLWMGDPDRSQHATAPGSATSLAAIKSVDGDLAFLLQALERKHLRDSTDILLASDHGFSAIERSIDVTDRLTRAGFSAEGAGSVRVVGNGGTDLFYVHEHDSATTARLVEWLQQTDFAGVIFARGTNEGAFPLSRVHLDSANGPDVVMAFRWNDHRNAAGVPGMIAANGKGEAEGTHGTLSPFDLHNVLIAAGPDFRHAYADETPSSNLDVAPTILHLLGNSAPDRLDGRVLTEALVDGAKPTKSQPAKTVAVSRTLKGGRWRQYLRISHVGDSDYLDEGNGEFVPAKN